MKRLWFLSAGLAAFAGCAPLKQVAQGAFKEPNVSFKSATLGDVSLGSATVNLVYSVENPNPLGLSLAEVSYAFFVEGKQVIAGQPPKGLEVPAEGSADLEFPASVKFADLAAALETFLTKDFATYRAEGQVGIQTPVGVLTFPLSREGQFEVPKVPKLELGSPRIGQLSGQRASLEIPVTVMNRNSYSLPVQNFSGAIRLGETEVGTLASGDFGQLEAKGTRQLTLPVTIDYGQAALALAAARGTPTEVSFRGQVSSGGVSIPLRFTQVLRFTQ